jgi:hypothetical protein
MKEIDLRNIWKSDRDKAREHYESLKDVEKLAKKQSHSVLTKIHRNIYLETVFSVLLVILFGYGVYTWNSGLPFWIFTLFFGFLIYLSIRIYRRFAYDLRMAHQKGVADALRSYVRIVGKYIWRQKILIYYITPFGYLVGLVVGTTAGDEKQTLVEILQQIGLGALIGLPFLFLAIWFFSRKYIKWIYGRHYESLKNILKCLEQEEQEENSEEESQENI